MIYIIAAVGRSRVKIGWSKNPQYRLKQLQTGNPERLRLVKTYQCDRIKERFIHRQLFPFRERFNGEWFRLSETDAVDLCDRLLSKNFGKKKGGKS